MWQYTDGTAGPDKYGKIVPGIGKCDRDLFNGDVTGLCKLWNVKPDTIAAAQKPLEDYTEDEA